MFNLKQNNIRYACKTIPRSKVDDILMLKEECSNLEDVRGHPHLLDFEQTFEDDKEVHIITELLEGGELYEAIIEMKKRRTNFQEDDSAWMVRNILDGLSYCHDVTGIVHRDLKASNFMFKRKIKIPERDNKNKPIIKTRNSQNLRDIKIIDFGMSTKIGVDTGKVQGCLGTPYYVAPEVLSEKFYDIKCDIWSVGVIAYLILSKQLPFQGKDEQETVHILMDAEKYQPKYDSARWMALDPLAVYFCKSLLQKDPSKRPTAREAMSHPWIIKHCGPPPPQRQRINLEHSIIVVPIEDGIAPPPLIDSLTFSSSKSVDSDQCTSSTKSVESMPTLSPRNARMGVLMDPIPEKQRPGPPQQKHDSRSKNHEKKKLLQRWFSSSRGHRSEVETIDFTQTERTENMLVLEECGA